MHTLTLPKTTPPAAAYGTWPQTGHHHGYDPCPVKKQRSRGDSAEVAV